jgi:hypothetical protein
VTGVPVALRAIRDALVANLPAGTLILVGPGNTDDPGLQGMVLVGCADPDERAYAEAAQGSQSWAQLGGLRRDETFSVRCSAVSWNGNSDALAAMDGAFALMGGLEAAIVADPSLGRQVLYVVGVTSYALRFAASSSGVSAFVLFDVECRTRI